MQLPHVPQLPHEQSPPHWRPRCFIPEVQLPQLVDSESSSLGAQPAVMLQPLQSPQSSQAQAALQVRERVRSSPHVPQLSGSVSVSPAAHNPSPEQISLSH